MSVVREKTVKIADLKAHLSEYLRVVRAGNALTVLSRETPVARIAPVSERGDALKVRKPVRDPKTVRLLPPVRLKMDSLTVLLADRRTR